MKKIFIILLIAISFVFFSCKKETVPATQANAGTTTTVTNTSKFADPGPTIFSSCNTWKLANFSSSGADQTPAYSSSSLIFCPDHTFTISNDVMSRNGQWSFGSFSVLGALDFSMTFNDGDIPLDAWANLQDTWKVRSYNSSTLNLQSSDGKKTMTIEKVPR